MEIIPKKTTSNSVKIAIAFLVSGITLFIFSIFVGSQIVCVFGLGLIFWVDFFC